MATDCFLGECEKKANTDGGGKIPLATLSNIYKYNPPKPKSGQVVLGTAVYFCCAEHMFDYMKETGIVSEGERHHKNMRARDESDRTKRELRETKRELRKKRRVEPEEFELQF